MHLDRYWVDKLNFATVPTRGRLRVAGSGAPGGRPHRPVRHLRWWYLTSSSPNSTPPHGMEALEDMQVDNIKLRVGCSLFHAVPSRFLAPPLALRCSDRSRTRGSLDKFLYRLTATWESHLRGFQARMSKSCVTALTSITTSTTPWLSGSWSYTPCSEGSMRTLGNWLSRAAVRTSTPLRRQILFCLPVHWTLCLRDDRFHVGVHLHHLRPDGHTVLLSRQTRLRSTCG